MAVGGAPEPAGLHGGAGPGLLQGGKPGGEEAGDGHEQDQDDAHMQARALDQERQPGPFADGYRRGMAGCRVAPDLGGYVVDEIKGDKIH